MMQIFQGKTVSPGIAMGPVVVRRNNNYMGELSVVPGKVLELRKAGGKSIDKRTQ